MRRRSRQLSAITGKARVEYFVPASVADALGGKDNYAFCSFDVERLLGLVLYNAQKAERKAKSAASAKDRIENLRKYGYSDEVVAREAKKKAAAAKRAAKSGNVFMDLVNEIEKDVAKLRARGVTGAIPVCFNRVTGKKSERIRAERRSTAVHERFHADARRVEVDGGVQKAASCFAQIEERLQPELTPELLRHSLEFYGRRQVAAEELLARVEEIRKACRTKRATTDCVETEAKVTRGMSPEEKVAFTALREAVEAKYGTPLNVVRAAVRSCTVR